MDTFAQWCERYSTATNQSLAGSRYQLSPSQDSQWTAQAAAWGIIDDLAAPPLGQKPDFDLTHASGEEAIAHARAHMPVLSALMDNAARTGIFKGVSIAVSIVLEPKTSVFLEELVRAGAHVGVYAGGESTDPRVIDPLRNQGVAVAADVTWSPTQRTQAALEILDELTPDIIVDDGASFARLALLKRPHLIPHLIGVAEETTSGVRAFAAMERDEALPFPVIAVNDSPLKTGFDNAHGTGETCVTSTQHILGADCFDGTAVTVVGYGPVGRGFAVRIRALGARVTIVDSAPVAALRAVFDGFMTSSLKEATAHADMVISATGVRHTLDLATLQTLREKTIVGVIGGIANEIALDELPNFVHHPKEAVQMLPIPNGPTLRLLADGDGVNYTVGNGNPIDIMDLSFAVQTQAITHLLTNRGKLSHSVMCLPVESDHHIATLALQSRGFSIADPTATATAGYDWRLTRFSDDEENAR